MDFPFQGSLVAAGHFPDFLIRTFPGNSDGVLCILLDLQRFAAELELLGEDKAAARYLFRREQKTFVRLTSDKRRREWLGGRFAAKYVAARVLARNKRPVAWSSLEVIADSYDRPFLSSAGEKIPLPDISISHSGDLAAAMAVSKGFCGIDIQKITERVIKVRDRFCAPAEARILQVGFQADPGRQSIILTKLWAAKEALRKAANMSPLPGFMELELISTSADPLQMDDEPCIFTFSRRHAGDGPTPPAPVKSDVAVSHRADYILALTTRNDTKA